jgi:hypothetical protein
MIRARTVTEEQREELGERVDKGIYVTKLDIICQEYEQMTASNAHLVWQRRRAKIGKF